ncbi:putative 26S proteasome regulatory subunit, partial [Ascosphaera atra]
MASPRNDINTPTISSGAANGVPKDLDAMTLYELFDEKDRLEGELKELSDVLKSNNADMNTPLLTPDGFPRSDIDVAQIRTTRARIIRLRNDYKGVMDRVEKGIHEHFARAREQGATVATPAPANASTASATLTNGTPSISTSQPQEDPSAPTFTPPFAKVNSVAPN